MTHGTLCEEVPCGNTEYWLSCFVLHILSFPLLQPRCSPKQGFLETFEQGQYQIKCALQDHFRLALSSKLVKTLLCFVALPIINEIQQDKDTDISLNIQMNQLETRVNCSLNQCIRFKFTYHQDHSIIHIDSQIQRLLQWTYSVLSKKLKC